MRGFVLFIFARDGLLPWRFLACVYNRAKVAAAFIDTHADGRCVTRGYL